MGRTDTPTPSVPLCTWGARHAGQPVFVLGNGPSLRGLDLSRLDRFVTVGCNRILRAYDPTYWIFADDQSVDDTLPNNVVAEARRSRAVCLTSPRYVERARALGLETHAIAFAGTADGAPQTCGISDHPGRLYTFGSIGLTCFSFAHATGADPIILLGIDCGNGPDGATNFYGTNPWQAESNYAMWTINCRWIQEHCTRRVVNCGWVPCFDRMDYGDAIGLADALVATGDRRRAGGSGGVGGDVGADRAGQHV